MIRAVLAFVVGLIAAVGFFLSGALQWVSDYLSYGAPVYQAPVVETTPLVQTVAVPVVPVGPLGPAQQAYPGAGYANAPALAVQNEGAYPYQAAPQQQPWNGEGGERGDGGERGNGVQLRLVVLADPNMPPNARRCGLYAFANRTDQPVLLVSDNGFRQIRPDGSPADTILVRPGEVRAQECGPVFPPTYVGVPPGLRPPPQGEPPQPPIVTIELHTADGGR